MKIVLIFCLALLLQSSVSFGASDIDARVESGSGKLHVSVSLHVDATPQEVWAVLIDYESAPRYVSDLEESRITERKADYLRVYQKSRIRLGPISLPVESTREVHLFAPARIEAHQVSGTFGAGDTLTQLEPEHGGTRLRYEAISSKHIFVPNALVRSEAEKKFAELRAEILRRKEAGQLASRNGR